jgi:uncharacterized protein (DUF58 family)
LAPIILLDLVLIDQTIVAKVEVTSEVTTITEVEDSEVAIEVTTTTTGGMNTVVAEERVEDRIYMSERKERNLRPTDTTTAITYTVPIQ